MGLIALSDVMRPWIAIAVKSALIISGAAFIGLMIIAFDDKQFYDKTEADEE